MHENRRAHDVAAKDLRDALMAKTNAENWNVGAEFHDQLRADPGVLGSARSGRDADAIRLQRARFFRSDLVIAFHQDLGAELAEILDEVVGERIVVIDDEHVHRFIPSARAIACSIALALFTHSSYSRAGSESATMP